MRKLGFACVFFFLVFRSFNSMAVLTEKEVQTFTLNNGMKILVVEDGSIPNANMYTFWKVGSRNEAPGTTGLSHFFEHMMFNGSKKYGPKMFDRTMEANGGSNNAYTTADITVYTNWFPAQALETIFDLEADRIAHLSIGPKMVESERGVVASERSTRLENSNFSLLYTEMLGVAFRAHPYSWPVIGHASDIAAWDMDDLKSYYKTYYAPNNAVVVIAGDVTLEQVKKLAKKYFEPIPAQSAPKAVRTIEPEQKGERRFYVHKASASSENLMMAYHIPEENHTDTPALNVLADILGKGKSSRLYQRLIEQDKIASSVYAFRNESLDPHLFFISAVANGDISAKKMESVILEEIQLILKEGITEQELQKVKNQRLADYYRQMATINGKANLIGTYEVYVGDYRTLYRQPEIDNAVTVDDVLRVAKQYFKKSNQTVGILGPKEDIYAQ
ncbi:M16 family metallopeptidase [Algicola sagamiensis]|uniref:M16 family metallopeptidase n=1 Tax=Algicola sagamiensis TaxID=163869 RepID=UPI0004761EB9